MYGVVGPRHRKRYDEEKYLESYTTESESLVSEVIRTVADS